MVTVVLIYSNNCAIWILLTTNNCEGLFGSFTPSVKAKVKVVAASYCGTGTGGTTYYTVLNFPVESLVLFCMLTCLEQSSSLLIVIINIDLNCY